MFSGSKKTAGNFLHISLTIKIFCMTLLMVSQMNPILSQTCNCDHIIPVSQTTISGTTLNIQPGDTICLQAGLKPFIYFTKINGDSLNPVVIMNTNGTVIVQNTSYNYGIKFAQSSYFRLTGAGIDSLEYGIKILQTKTGTNGLTLDEKSTNFEVDHLEISNTGFAGIMCKTDPKCDLSTNAGNFTMRDVRIHDNYIYNTGGEGMYIGHSYYSGYNTTCNGQPAILYPHEIKGLRVYHNRVEGTWYDGIQIGCANEDCEIYENTVLNYGTGSNNSHITGIQLGGGTTGKCYNNFVSGGMGTGIMVFGLGNIVIANNVIENAGLNYFPNDPTKRVYGIYIGERETWAGSYFNLVNNTIVNVKTDGIRFANQNSTNNKIANNIIINPGSLGSYTTTAKSYIYPETGVSINCSNNFTEPDTTNIRFRNPENGNYRLKEDSPAKDMGIDATNFGVTFDYDSLLRPQYNQFDIGACEFTTDNVWNGRHSSDWNNPANWSKADVPSTGDNVVIPAGTVYVPVVTLSGVGCHNLTIAPGAGIEIAPFTEVTIAGNLTIEAGGLLDNSGTIYLKGNLSNLNE